MFVSDPRVYKDDRSGLWTASFRVESEHHLPQEVWYRFSEGPLSDASDYILSSCLIPAMRKGLSLRIPGEVSLRLPDCTKIQDFITRWYPDFRRIDIDVGPAEISRPASKGRVAAFFSGGIDSSYTLLTHLDEIDTVILVHGFDMRLSNLPLRRQVSSAVRETAEKLGKACIEVETNIRDFVEPHIGWSVYHSSALIGIALLLSRTFKKVFIPGALIDDNGDPDSVHPFLAQVWSNAGVQIVYDGGKAARVQKAESIAKNDVVLKYLRVCYENRRNEYNCCECGKCLRAMIVLRIAGALGRCSAFKRPLDLSKVARIRVNDEMRPFFEETLLYLRHKGHDPLLERALQKCLGGYWKGFLGWRAVAGALLKLIIFGRGRT